MASKVLASAVLRALYVQQTDRYKFLRLIFSGSQMRFCRNYKTSVGNDFFNSVEVSKYLNFISQDPQKHLRTNESEHISNLFQSRRDLEKELSDLEKMSSEGDKELEKLMESERETFLQSLEQINNEILWYIRSGNDEDDNRNVELRIVAGIGGEEAKLFSEELFTMYLNYAELKGWECSGHSKGDSTFISGEFVFGHLRHEAGVHRVQRVPATENSGRIHTSTCSVIVLPQPKPHEIQIPEKDLVVEKMRSSGPGGQNVNKRETCVRIRHIPTGIAVESQVSRYQYENYKIAVDKLRSTLFNIEQEKIKSERKTLMKDQAGTNDYSDKIRTYNFPQSRVTDHRLNYSTQNLRGFLSGKKELDSFISKLKEDNWRKELMLEIRNTLASVEFKNFANRQQMEG